MKRVIFIILLCGFFISACNSKDNDGVIRQERMPISERFSKDSLRFHPTGGKITFTVQADEQECIYWGWNGDKDKCPEVKFEPKAQTITVKGSEGQCLQKGLTKVTLELNAALSDVEGYLDFQFDFDQPEPEDAPVYVYQDAARLTIDPTIKGSDTIKFKWYQARNVYGQQAFNVKINSNTVWYIKGDKQDDIDNWLYASQLESKDDVSEDTVSFLPQEYFISKDSNVPRQAKVLIQGYFETVGDNFYKQNVDTITFVQEPLRFAVGELKYKDDDNKKIESSLPPCNVPKITMNVKSEEKWIVKDTTLTLAFAPEEGDPTETKGTDVELTIPNNPTRDERTFSFTVVPNVQVTDTVGNSIDFSKVLPNKKTLTQEGYVLDFNGEVEASVELQNADTEQRIIPLNSSGKFQLKCPDWLDVGDNGNNNAGNRNVSYKAKERNYDTDNRVGTIEVTSDEKGVELSAKLKVSQAKYNLSTDLAETSTFNCNVSGETNAKTFNVTSSGDWALYDCDSKSDITTDSWLNFSKLNGDSCDGCKVSFYPKENNKTDKDKSISVLLYSKTHADAGKKLEIGPYTFTQYAFRFKSSLKEGSIITFNAVDNAVEKFTITSTAGGHDDVKVDVENGNEWITLLSKKEAKNSDTDAEISVNVAKNIYEKERTGKIIISSDYDENKKFSYTVSQSGYVWGVIAGDEYELPAVGAKNEISIKCSGAWTYESNNNDMIASQREVSGTEDYKKYKFEFNNNYNLKESREVTLTLKSKDNADFNKAIKFTQEPFTFDTTSESLNLEASDSEKEKSFNVGKCVGTWKVETSSEDVKFNTVMNDDDGSGTVNLKIPPYHINETDMPDSRDITVKVLSEYYEENDSLRKALCKEVTITQTGYKFIVTEENGENVNNVEFTNGNDYISINVDCSGDWSSEVEDSGDFGDDLEVVESSDNKLKITVAPNYTLEKREGKVRVSSGDLHVDIKVEQAAFVFDTAVETLEFKASNSTEQETFTMGDCTGEWTIIDDVDWVTVTVTPTDGSGNDEITVKVDPYTTTDETVYNTQKSREGKIYVKSNDYENNKALIKTVKVKQELYYLIVKDNIELTNETENGNSGTIPINCSGTWAFKINESDFPASAITAEKNGDKELKVSVDSDTVGEYSATIKVSSGDSLYANIRVSYNGVKK